jgi:hypothetical protein
METAADYGKFSGFLPVEFVNNVNKYNDTRINFCNFAHKKFETETYRFHFTELPKKNLLSIGEFYR